MESPEEQLEEVLEWLPEGVKLEDCLILQEACSASRYSPKARVEWPKALAAMATGEYDGIVTWETSRSTRKLGDHAAFRDLLEAQGMWYIASERAYDVSNVDDDVALGYSAVNSEAESKRTSKRVTRTVAKRAKKGAPSGRTPFGFERTYEIEAGQPKLVGQRPHPEHGPMVRDWADRVLSGKASVNQISKETGRHMTTIRRTLLSPTTAGLRVHRDKTYPGQWEGIITIEEHEALNRLLLDPRRNNRRHAASGRRHPFTGILRCGKCKGPLYMRSHPKGPRYQCVRDNAVSVTACHVDELVLTALQARIDQRSADLGPDRDDAAAQREVLEAKLVALEEELDRYDDERRVGDLSEKRYRNLTKKVEADQVTTQIELDKLRFQPVEIDALDGVVVAEITDVNELHAIAIRLLEYVDIMPTTTRGARFDVSRVRPMFR
jgi:DNA invertase Pin-like site-specific DNA recombinase